MSFVTPLSLAVALALTPLAPSRPVPVEDPAPLHCVRTCSPDLTWNSAPDWVIVGSAVTHGEAFEFCEPCKPCKMIINVQFLGAEAWTTGNGTSSSSGTGPQYSWFRVETDCDGTELGTVTGVGGSGGPLVAQVYCYCD